MSDAVSDVQRLMHLGYPEDVCKTSLKEARGDYQLALRMVQQKCNASSTGKVAIDSSWTHEQQDDWIRNVPTSAMSLDAKTRALGKSPIYIRIPSYERQYGDNDRVTVGYKVAVTLKDSRRWDIVRSFDDFLRLYSMLPYGTCAKFKASFPKTATMVHMMGSIFTLSDAQVEERRSRLESWLLEVCLTESCMCSDVVLDLVYSFLQADAHGGRVTSAGASASAGGSVTGSAAASSSAVTLAAGGGHHSGQVLGLPGMPDTSSAAAGAVNYKYSVKLPVATVDTVPVPLERLGAQLPFKVGFSAPLVRVDPRSGAVLARGDSLADMLGVAHPAPAAAASATAAAEAPDRDRSAQQLEKDYSRDRVVVQGRRLQGSACGFGGVLAECERVVAALVVAAEKPPPLPQAQAVRPAAAHACTPIVAATAAAGTPAALGVAPASYKLGPAAIKEFCMELLAAAGRTESAFRSHASLSLILDLLPATGPDSEPEAAEPPLPYIVVPESELAKPIEVNFQLKRKPPSAGASASAAAQGADWCIVCDVQAATVYKICHPEAMEAAIQLKVTYYHQVFKFPGPPAPAPAPKSKVSTWLLVEKDTTTTRRDWQQQL